MKTTKLIPVFGLFAVLILSLSLASAAVVFTPTSLTGTGDDGTTVNINLNIENTYAGDLSEISAVFTDLTKTTSSTTIADSNLALSGVDSTTVIIGTADLDVSVDIQIPSDKAIGTYEGELELFAKVDAGDVLSRGIVPITLTVTSATPSDQPEEINECSLDGNIVGDAELKISIEDINVKEGFGDDEDFWYPYDEIEIEIDVENKGDWDLENIELNWGLYNDNEEDFIIDDKENDFKLDEGDDAETIKISFKLDKKIKDYADGTTTLYVWATGDIDDKNAGSYDGDTICASDSHEIDIRTDEKFVIVSSADFPEVASCGDTIQVSFEVTNIGDEKQEDITVDISSYQNNAMGIIKQTISIGDLGDFDSEDFFTSIVIPEGLEERTYYIEFTVFDEDGDEFENDEDDIAKFAFPINIVCGADSSAEPTITAALASAAKVGEELVVQVSIKNNGDATDFLVFVEGYETWSELINIEPTILTIPEDGTKQTTITLNPTQAGSQTFKIKTIHNGKTAEQIVTVNIAEKASSGITGAFAGVGDTGLYVISAIFLILIIIIIALIVKVARSPVAAEF